MIHTVAADRQHRSSPGPRGRRCSSPAWRRHSRPQPHRARPCWRQPVVGAVDRPVPRAAVSVVLPATAGSSIAPAAGSPARSVAAGTRHVQRVGRRHALRRRRPADGWRSPTAGLPASRAARGDRVDRRERWSARSARGFYFGLRVDGRYVDPAPHLGRLVGRRPSRSRSTAPRPGRRPRRLRCRSDPLSRADSIAQVDSIRHAARSASTHQSRRSRAVALGADRWEQPHQGVPPWLSSACVRCWRPEPTSVTRPAAGTRR